MGCYAVITPQGPFQLIFDTLDIDGTTAPGYVLADIGATPVIQIDASATGATSAILEFSAPDSGVRALAIYSSPDSAIFMVDTGATVEGCHIGLALRD